MTIGGIPIRAFAGMARLDGHLPAVARTALARAMASRVVDRVVAAGCEPVVVTSDTEVGTWARRLHVTVLDDPPGGGLDGAARAVVAHAGDDRWLVLHADLPAVDTADITAMTGGATPALAPSKDGGTAAISSTGPFRFSYGVDSFRRHLAAAGPGARVVVRPGLAFDIDHPRDLMVAELLGVAP